ncbi:hypothetical protein LINPERHAP1_LOCUS5581 [Linum perenne]
MEMRLLLKLSSCTHPLPPLEIRYNTTTSYLHIGISVDTIHLQGLSGFLLVCLDM